MSWFHDYLTDLHRVMSEMQVTDRDGNPLDADGALDGIWADIQSAHDAGGRTMFIGNGGSAGICSHSAIDYCNAGGVRAMCFNDGAALTCLGNDYGFDQVFSRQVAIHGAAGDVLMAISSSGRSADILNACETMRGKGGKIVTFSGFDGDNPLRAQGDVNIYLNSHAYGFVELGHMIVIHAILDRGNAAK